MPATQESGLRDDAAPAPLAPLYGRAGDGAAFGESLPSQRAVTLVGSAGIGKTTLARAVAQDLGGRYGGARLVELAPVADPRLVVQAVAGAPGFAAGAGEEAVQDHGAVELFVARARAADPRFTLTADNAGHGVEICRRLDGLALAVVGGTARKPWLPVVPTAVELGMPSFDGTSWIGLVVPAGTPAAVAKHAKVRLD